MFNVNASDTNALLNKIDYNIKIKNIEKKIPWVTNLATADSLTVVKNKIKTLVILTKNPILLKKWKKKKWWQIFTHIWLYLVYK